MSVITVGIDLSTKKLALVHVDDSGVVLTTKEIVADKLADADQRFNELVCGFALYLDTTPDIDRVCVEGTIFHRNPRTSILLSRVLGAIQGALVLRNIPYIVVDSQVWKRGLGIGRGKEKIREFVSARGVDDLESQDLVDALCIAWYGAVKWYQHFCSPKCEAGCQCGRHVPHTRGRLCEPGCRCGRHRGQQCSVGCSCDRHKLYPTPQAFYAARLRAMTRPQLDLASFLLDAGFELVPEVTFGRARVDLYEPHYHLAFEADGDYWHGRSGKAQQDAERDKRLLEDFGLPVIRFWQSEIKGLRFGDGQERAAQAG